MLRMFLIPALILSAALCCMGQTFQYSRGWTNGKRSSAHLREDYAFPEMTEYQDVERRLEKCLGQLQHLIRNPLIISGPFPAIASMNNANVKGKYPSRHPASDFMEDLVASNEPAEFIKHQQNALTA